MDFISWINNAAFGAVSSVASPALTFLMKYWAESFYVVLLAILAYFYLKRDKNFFPFGVSLIVLFAIGEVIKDIVKEPRPCASGEMAWLSQVACDPTYSFPSNHATVLTGLFIFLKNYKYVRAAYIIWVLIILFGRVYLGQHYFTDVVAGAAISIVVCYITYRYERVINRIAGAVLGKLFGWKVPGA
jgi:undecaprenyl-diphosphatase